MQFTADPRPTEDDQSAADYLRYIKVHEIARETLHQTHSRQLINKYRLEKKMERYLGLLTDEDMHSLLDYLAFLASRHTEEAIKGKRSIGKQLAHIKDNGLGLALLSPTSRLVGDFLYL